MIQLHVLGRSDDGTQLLLAAHPEADTPGYTIAIDESVLEMFGQSPVEAEALADADAADFDVEPEEEPEPELVLPEGPLDVDSPAAALETAHSLPLIRGEGDPEATIEVSDETLHDAVIANLHRWNVRIAREILDEGWWVTKLGDKAWQISFRFLSRGRIHEAEWVLDTDAARLVPENDLAELLGWVKSGNSKNQRRRRRGGRGRGRARQRTRSGSGSGRQKR